LKTPITLCVTSKLMARNSIKNSRVSQGNSRAGNFNSETVHSWAQLRALDTLGLVGPGTPIFTKAKPFGKDVNERYLSRRCWSEYWKYFEPCARYEGVNISPLLYELKVGGNPNSKKAVFSRVPISLQSATSLPANRVDWQLLPLPSPLSAVAAFFLLSFAYLAIIRSGEAFGRADFLSSLHTPAIPHNYNFCHCYRY
jgi:hypothetical protein